MWYWAAVSGHNRRSRMDITPEQIEEIEAKLSQLETMDPAELPEPAAELVALLSKILDEGDDDS